MTHAPLFAGINGFGVAADWMGWEQPFHCEIDPFCQRVIQYYWPNSIPHYDIRETDFTIYRGQIDVLSGGFPCQPFSTAGQRKGTEDDRHLWPEMLRAIREIAPGYVVGENVYGLVNWSGGLVFDQVQADLEDEGYEVLPVILPACGKDAPHRRDRIWFVAYSGHIRQTKRQEQPMGADKLCKKSTTPNPQLNGLCNNAQQEGQQLSGRGPTRSESAPPINSGVAANANGSGFERRVNQEERELSINGNTWGSFPTQSPVCSGNDGFSSQLDGITFSKWRNESIKAAGNAIVPQIAYEIFKAIEAA